MRIQQIDAGGVNRTITGIKQIDAGGTTRSLKTVWQVDANGMARQIFGSIASSASASPDAVSGYANSKGSATVSSNSTTASTTSTSPVTGYSWQSADAGGISPVNPTQATTAFRGVFGPSDGSTASFVCTLTFQSGATADTNPVLVTLSNIHS